MVVESVDFRGGENVAIDGKFINRTIQITNWELMPLCGQSPVTNFTGAEGYDTIWLMQGGCLVAYLLAVKVLHHGATLVVIGDGKVMPAPKAVGGKDWRAKMHLIVLPPFAAVSGRYMMENIRLPSS